MRRKKNINNSKPSTTQGPLSQYATRVLAFTVAALLLAPILVDYAYVIGTRIAFFHISFSKEQVLNNLSVSLGAMSALWMGLLSFSIAKQSNDISKRLLDIEIGRKKPTISNIKQGKPLDQRESIFGSERRMMIHIDSNPDGEYDHRLYIEFLNDSQNRITQCSVIEGKSSCDGFYALLDHVKTSSLSVQPGSSFTLEIWTHHTISYPTQVTRENTTHVISGLVVMSLHIEIFSDTVSNKYAILLNQLPDGMGGQMFITQSQWNPDDEMTRNAQIP